MYSLAFTLYVKSVKNCGKYQQLSIFARYYEIWDKIKKEWVLVRREVLVSGLFFRSRSLETFYLASNLKIIATAVANVPAEV